MVFRIEKGRPTAEELAALISVLTAWSARRGTATGSARVRHALSRSGWNRGEHRVAAFRDPRSWRVVTSG
ncbi:acyl-CoA carboxylase subunit epsilon [Streptosporangium sp. NPDC001559]|uniref:acyl-CoA carboxylase subunit epsilon n=1 Tax=Streptosporangium sp. NPDC001559 TaxID=3366187 RepID=UPI0036E51203